MKAEPRRIDDPRAPNFFIVGAMKAATTSLAATLGEHPEIFVSAVKEPHFFADLPGCEPRLSEQLIPYSTSWSSVRPHGPLRCPTTESYLALFAGAEHLPLRGEASISYLPNPSAAAALAAAVPDAKIIAVLRNVYERAHSGYTYLRSRGREPAETFRQAIEHELAGHRDDWSYTWRHVLSSCYHAQLERYFAHFPPEQVRIVWFDDLKADPERELAAICTFLGCAPAPLELKRENRTVLHDGGLQRSVKSALLYLPARRLARRILSERVYPYAKGVAAALIGRIDRSGRTPPPISADEIDLLAGTFEPEIDRLERMTGRDLTPWRLGAATREEPVPAPVARHATS